MNEQFIIIEVSDGVYIKKFINNLDGINDKLDGYDFTFTQDPKMALKFNRDQLKPFKDNARTISRLLRAKMLVYKIEHNIEELEVL